MLLRCRLTYNEFIAITIAHSAPARPLRRLAHPSTLALEILPRHEGLQSIPISAFNKRLPPANTLRHDDSFRLTISAFDETFHLHLRPNHHLIHPAARINYYSTNSDGQSILTHSEPLIRETVKAYWGEVIAPDHSPARMREDAAGAVHEPHPSELGWVRLMIHHQGDMENGVAPRFEGAFSVKGVVYHIMTKENYIRTKNEFDPDVAQPLDDIDSTLVIWRESDVMTVEEERRVKRGESLPDVSTPTDQSCGHDRLSFNTDPEQNAILQKPISPNPWYNKALGLFRNDTMQRRDDVTGSGDMGTK